MLYDNQSRSPLLWISIILTNRIHAGVIPAGGVGVQYALSISSADWRNLPMDCATKNPHLNENRAFCYGVLENISLRNKDRNSKSRAKQISKLCLHGWFFEEICPLERDSLMLSLFNVGFVLLQCWLLYKQILECINTVQIRIKCCVFICGSAVVQELCLMNVTSLTGLVKIGGEFTKFKILYIIYKK